ncbi:ExbD/TolR family protein [Stappia sp.]|jgi:biopolymer transport protein ExbD|uniref:ExbD/TolR family protein n=1 Tax=Stappia sp. TaxID=1870903 RepID=UPI003A9A3158
MIRLPRPAVKRQAESTISLINVVFLMLIFFLIAGQLSPPVDPEVDLVETEDAPPLPPPDALFVDAQGALRYRGAVITAEAYLAELASEGAAELPPLPADTAEAQAATPAGPPVLLAADRELDASVLLETVDTIYRAGASKVSLVTMGETPEAAGDLPADTPEGTANATPDAGVGADQ